MPAPSFLLPENAITVIRGESKTIGLSVVDSAGKAIDLTGATVYFTVKKSVSDAAALIQKASTDTLKIAIPKPREGKAEIYLDPPDTKNLNPGSSYVFDVWVILSSGKRHAVIPPSAFSVESSVTVLP